MSATERPRVLIEDWLPIEELGIESQRERGASSALPPLYFLHVWWARRPLTVSRAAVLASLLPAYSDEWPKDLRTRFPTEDSYRAWFLRLLGIRGDPKAGKRLIAYAKERDIKLKINPYGYPRAFTVVPGEEDLTLMQRLFLYVWETSAITVADPMAGGGSIPFEALRFGLTTHAYELNPVASVILQATLDYPARFGLALADDILKYGRALAKRVEEDLGQFYPRQPSESIFAYLWARTVACPYTGKPVPLSLSWWLRKGSEPMAVRMVADPLSSQCRFEIASGSEAVKSRPDEGTIKRGVGRSPWANWQAIDGDYIRAEAQAGRMGQQLYAVAVKTSKGLGFRVPTQADIDAVTAAAAELDGRLPRWNRDRVVPAEPFPEVSNDPRPLRYGMPLWRDMFSPRQLLAHGTCVQVIRAINDEINEAMPPDRAKAVMTYLAFVLDKGCDRNSYMARWIPQRGIIANTFDRHNFAIKWSFAEFDAAHNMLPWTVDQITDAYSGIARLAESAETPLFTVEGERAVDRSRIERANAASLTSVPDRSVHAICVDPPYYANVMYAELSNFFYVWEKVAIGHLYPGWFSTEIVDADEEAVANFARFASVGATLLVSPQTVRSRRSWKL